MKCIACKWEIPDGATFCSICRLHQSPWKNCLPYLAGGVAFLFLVASAVTYVATNSVALWKSVTWKDEVMVLNYKSLEKGVFLNTGDGEVFLLRLEIRCPPLGWEQISRINRVVKPNEFLVHELGQAGKDFMAIVYTGSEQEGIELLRKGLLTPEISDMNNPSLAMFRRNLGDRFVTFPGEVKLVFYSSRDGKELSSSIPSWAYLVRKAPLQQTQ